MLWLAHDVSITHQGITFAVFSQHAATRYQRKDGFLGVKPVPVKFQQSGVFASFRVGCSSGIIVHYDNGPSESISVNKCFISTTGP